MPTVEDNASRSDVLTETQQDTSQDTDALQKAQQELADLKEKHAAARKGMDDANLSKKELQAEIARLKVLAGESETKVEEETEEPQTVTKEELQAQLWELKHAEDVEIYGDEEYQNDIKSGIPKEYALKTAKLRYQSNPEQARLARNKSHAQGSSASDRNLEDKNLEGFNQEQADFWGYDKETYLKHKKLKEARG